VDARRCVREQLRREALAGEWHVVAVGKAAGAMSLGALDVLGPRLVDACIVAPRDHVPPELRSAGGRMAILRGTHPIPDAASLAAGEALVRFMQDRPATARLLFLVSGGASSLVEYPVDGITLADLQAVGEWALASGRPIGEVNAVRRQLSRIKGGGLAAMAGTRRALALMISDVPGDDPATIGSGMLHAVPAAGAAVAVRASALPRSIGAILRRARAARPRTSVNRRAAIPARIVASQRTARVAAARAARQRGVRATASREGYSGDAAQLGVVFATAAAHLPERTLRVWSGESTVRLPAAPGRGGRNQHLALSAACTLAGIGRDGVWLLAAGTDGIDGVTDDAGALVDAGTCRRGQDAGYDCHVSLDGADSGSFLEASGDLLHTGATLTNVGDLVVGLRWGGCE
jgi:hydroxypyruvate reductase